MNGANQGPDRNAGREPAPPHHVAASGAREREVEITYLEMTSPAELEPAPRAPELRFERAAVPSPELGRFLYTAVGGDWHWVDRLGWDRDAWRERLSEEGVETWVGYVGGNPAGYAELEIERGGDARIVYFGLLPDFVGRGLGGDLLTRAVERCWEAGAARVHLDTCSLDGPAALPNYRRRGFRVHDRRSELRTLADEPPGPWPGARGEG